MLKTWRSLVAAAASLLALAAMATGARAPARVADLPARASLDEPVVASPLLYGGVVGKAAVDTITLMGPGGAYPHRGDFETANALPDGDGALPGGWTSVDATVPSNHWHVATTNNPGTGNGAWCGDPSLAACDGTDPVGGYGNNWRDILEFRRTVSGPATVRVQARLRYDTEPGYDFLTLQRRTAAGANFEPVAGGQGLSWDGGPATVDVDYTFSYTADELVDGSDIDIAFVFASESGWSDSDCLWPTSGAAQLDNLVVTVEGATFSEDFEDGAIGPEWTLAPNAGVGDFARVWRGLCDADPCSANPSHQVAFIDNYPNLWFVPPPPAGCGAVNSHGGFLGGMASLDNWVVSPAMALPGGNVDGLTVAFDVYDEMDSGNSAPIAWGWSIRSAAGGSMSEAPWVDRGFAYYGRIQYQRRSLAVGDLLVPGADSVQVRLRARQAFGSFERDNYSPSPYFDNVRVQAYPSAGPRLVANELYLASDAFPASGAVDLVNLGANSVRFDMAANISAYNHLRNDPGDSIVIDATPRSGGALAAPVLHWTFAVKNPLFADARRAALAPGQVSGSATGRVTRTAAGAVIANRWNFDLPDTGMLFPGDVLHYYISVEDNLAGDVRTSTLPADLGGFGSPVPGAFPGGFAVHCLPTLHDASGHQPPLLMWNDGGFGGGDDEWLKALALLKLERGVHFDLFSTRAPATGDGQGLGGRATPAQLAGYTDLFYTSGDLGRYTLASGNYNSDPSDDQDLLSAWIALGGRDLLLCGEDLAQSLQDYGGPGSAFLASVPGVQLLDGDVRDNIGGQVAPLVMATPGNPVFANHAAWLLYGGCPSPNDFDAIVPVAGAVTLARFGAAGGVGAPYPEAAAVLNNVGTSRVVTLPYDLSYVMAWDKAPMPQLPRAVLLGEVLDFFGVQRNPNTSASAVPAPGAPLSVTTQPNPFNPSLTLRYALPRPGHVVMKVFDARGALVRTLVDGPVATTAGVVAWDGADDRGGQVSSGLYFVETRSDGQVDVRKVTMLK